MDITISPSSKEVLAHWEESGRSYFTMSALRSALGASEKATKDALCRLLDARRIASPAKGFYLILSAGDRQVGCSPESEFIPPLMEYWGIPYYAGVLTASEYHGAAHQRPQVFQVMVSRPKKEIVCGGRWVQFVVRQNVGSIPTMWRRGSRSSLAVSTIEATAFDLVGYMRHGSGGLDRVSGMVYELAEDMNPKLLAEAAHFSPVAWAQRLGYLLDYAGAVEKASLLREYVHRRSVQYTKLVPYNPAVGTARSKDWKVILNQSIDMEA